MSKICWMDVETTGLDAVKQDIIQLAMIIEIDGEERERKQFTMQPFSYNNIQEQALRIHGIGVDTLRTFKKPTDVFTEIEEFLNAFINKYDAADKFIPAGYNVKFDMDFMKQFWIKSGSPFFGSYFHYNTIDPLNTLRSFVKHTSYKLVDMCKYYNIPHDNAHDAMSDISATKMLHELISDCIKVDLKTLELGYGEFCKRRREA